MPISRVHEDVDWQCIDAVVSAPGPAHSLRSRRFETRATADGLGLRGQWARGDSAYHSVRATWLGRSPPGDGQASGVSAAEPGRSRGDILGERHRSAPDHSSYPASRAARRTRALRPLHRARRGRHRRLLQPASRTLGQVGVGTETKRGSKPLAGRCPRKPAGSFTPTPLRSLGWLHFEHLAGATRGPPVATPGPPAGRVHRDVHPTATAARTSSGRDTEGYELSSRRMTLDEAAAAMSGDSARSGISPVVKE